MNRIETSNLDQEWVKLIKEAIEIGLSKEEIRAFFSNNQKALLANMDGAHTNHNVNING
ncbi:anti-repressor SinI family protein [Bacillaceae bacterium IKA-2]|nr:anti-repressor SinI family protein [Bacillaceae bacterium IKA-2]